MKDIRQTNLSHVATLFRNEMRLRDATDFLKLPHRQQQWLLRHHSVQEIVNKNEIRLRDSLDDLLAFYSVMEIGSVIEFFPERFPDNFRKEALGYLGNSHVREFYERTYPLLLPRLFLSRLKDQYNVRDKNTQETVALYMQFLDMNALLQRDEDVGTFLWFLDDYSLKFRSKYYSLNDTFGTLKDPQTFLRCMARKPRDQGPLEASLHGLRKFLAFCFEFDSLLRQAQDYPYFQSSMWHYHAYWFDILGQQTRGFFDQVLYRFQSWEEEKKALSFVFAETKPAIDEMKNVIERLTAREGYRSALETAWRNSRTR